MTISRRLLLLFLLVAVLPLALFSYFGLQQNEAMLRAEALDRMSGLADKKLIQVRSYLLERVQDVRMLARGPRVMGAVNILPGEYAQGWRNSAAYIQEDAKNRQYFDRYVEDAGVFYDVFLITPQGQVVYTQKHEADFATNLLTGPYRDSQLALAFRTASLTLEPVISGYEYYSPSRAPGLFIVAPVMVDGKFRGMFAVQLGNSLFYQVATDATGLGMSGEVAFAQRDGDGFVVATPLKHRPDAALKLKLGRQESLQTAMPLALFGEAGAGVMPDYRGKQVLAAWRYLPELDWGMVVKIDADEVFAPIAHQRIVMLATVLVLLLCAGLVAYYFGRRLAVPLQELARGAEDVARGNMTRRVSEQGADEIGVLGRAFNRMAENLQLLYRSLETRVEERTAELTRSLAELRIKDAAIASSMDPVAIAGMDGRISYVNQAYVELWRLQGPEDAVGHLPMEFLEDPEAAVAAMEILRRQGYWRGELRALRSDGSLADLELSANVVTDEAGKPVCMMASFHDVTERTRNQLELRHNQNLLNEAQRLGHIGSWELNHVSGELLWSDEVYRMLDLDQVQGQPSYQKFLEVVHPDDREKMQQTYMQSLKDRQPYELMHRLLLADGRVRWVQEYCYSDFDENGQPLRSVGTMQDITENKLKEDQLRIAAIAFETHEAIMITGPDNRIMRVNRAFERITGYSTDEVVGHTPHMLSSGKHDQGFYREMWRQIAETGQWQGEIWDRRRNGEEYPKWLTVTTVRGAAGQVSHYVGIFSDISQRKLAEEEIFSLAFYDTLTKLPNRRLLLDRFKQALLASERSGVYGLLLFLDLDKFKILNDTLGHGVGDMLLIEVAARIKACVREIDTIARMGGDEFVVLIEEADSDAAEATQKAAHIAEKIRSELVKPYLLGGQVQHSSPSIGVCLYLGRSESVDTLLKHADLAMYQAKEAGRNTVCFFDPVMQQAVEERAALEKDLRSAISLQEMHLYYQIQVDNEHRPLGAEALLRWIHPVRGMVSPAQFIPLAEESMLIAEIGQWVLEMACSQLKLWEKNPLARSLTLAINVGAQQFALPDFVAQVAAAIKKHHIIPSRLKLELTESVVLGDVQGTIATMKALRKLGVRLSMDDFGTGYSSLSYLKLLPLYQLKIDQSFVRDITADPNDALLVQTIIDMATNFRLDVIAEGVETDAQLAFLRRNGCKAYQGYLFSKPVPIEEFEALLGGHWWRHT